MRCVAVLGPSQTGKSTLVEELGKLGERSERVATPMGPDLTRFDFLGDDWVALDCPGSIESLCRTQVALLGADAAIVCVSPNPEEAVLAAPYLRAAETAGTPTLLFIGNIDRPRGRIRDVIAALQDYTQHSIVLRQIPIREGDQIVGATDLISERAWRYRHGQHSDLIEIPEDSLDRETEARSELLEQLADFDDDLLEQLIEDRQPATGPLFEIASRATGDNKLISAFLGSAANGNGIVRLMKALRHETPKVDALRGRLVEAAGALEGEPIAVCLQAYHRQHAGKTVVLRVLDKGVRQGRSVGGANLGGVQEALGLASGSTELPVGAVALAVKTDHLMIGEVYSSEARGKPSKMVDLVAPMMPRVLTAESDRDDAKLSTALEKLTEDDPGLTVEHEAGSGKLVANVQGPLHLRALREELKDVFGVAVKDDAPQTMYRETITKPVSEHYRHRKQTGGSGQFADIKLTIQPNARDAGFAFDESIKGGAVPSNYIPAVESGALEAMSRGPLGFPVIDVNVSLIDGQHHSVDSSDFAFRAAGRMGVREALAKASPVLLQPIHRVEIHVPSIYSGGLVAAISSLHGQVLGFDRDPSAKGWDLFQAVLPAPALDGLINTLRSATQGLGYYTSAFDHYEELYGREAELIQETQAASHA
jgi:elongation factor G